MYKKSDYINLGAFSPKLQIDLSLSTIAGISVKMNI